MRKAAKWFGAVLGLLVVLVVAAIIHGPPKVPAEAIASSVDRDTTRLDEAFALPAAATYQRELYWQTNGSLCGPASLVNARRSLGLPADDEDALLEGTGLCWTGMCLPGVTLDELTEIASAGGDLEVTVLRDLSAEEFREHLRAANDPDQRYVVNFTRKKIFGAGGGHHSPIGGYLEDEDLVLVLDVNEDFQPWLVERERLFEAMDTVDGSSERKRGMLLLRAAG